MDRKDFLERIRAAEKSRAGNALPAFDDSETVSFAALGDGTAREIFERNFSRNRADVIGSPEKLADFLKSKGCKKGVVDAALAADLRAWKAF